MFWHVISKIMIMKKLTRTPKTYLKSVELERIRCKPYHADEVPHPVVAGKPVSI